MINQVDYDTIAAEYGRRYERARYDGVRQAVVEFVTAVDQPSVLEVGCGTGHWLASMTATRPAKLAGVDPARRMLARACEAAPGAMLLQGRAEQLPFRAFSFDRIVCIHALHHFRDRAAFFAEARRLLRPEGGLLVVGMDPHAGTDRWWIYDYFPGAHEADRKRFPPASQIRASMMEAGFTQCTTRVVQRISTDLTVRAGVERGDMERSSTSQLMVITDEEYARGMAKLRQASPDTRLQTELNLYANSGWVPPASAISSGA